jgi:hypothetical protein
MICARRRPCTNLNSPLAGTWQVAFLGKAEPRATRPGKHARRVMPISPDVALAVNKGPVLAGFDPLVAGFEFGSGVFRNGIWYARLSSASGR